MGTLARQIAKDYPTIALDSLPCLEMWDKTIGDREGWQGN